MAALDVFVHAVDSLDHDLVFVVDDSRDLSASPLVVTSHDLDHITCLQTHDLSRIQKN